MLVAGVGGFMVAGSRGRHHVFEDGGRAAALQARLAGLGAARMPGSDSQAPPFHDELTKTIGPGSKNRRIPDTGYAFLRYARFTTPSPRAAHGL